MPLLFPLAAVALTALAGLGLLGQLAAVLRAWVFAAHFWTGVSLGAAVLLLIHAITGGRWGQAMGPGLRAAAGAMPVAALAWLPLILTAPGLFPWAGAEPSDLPETVARKLAYLDVGFLQVRTVVVLLLFLLICWVAAGPLRQRWGAAGAATLLMVYAFAVSILSIDWLLAFEPEFYSTAYPPIHATGGVVAAMAFGTLILWASDGARDPLADCGMLMLGWAMVWLYLVYMQYLIIWSGDLPQEIAWYLRRSQGGFGVALWLAIGCHAVVIAAMASPRLKQRPDAVAAAAGVLLLGQAVDLWWRSAPAFAEGIGLVHLIDLLAVIALGLAWLAAASLGRRRCGEARHA